jgi:hypothetical protein
MFFSDTFCLCDVEWWNACAFCMHACLLLLFLLPAIESNDTECNDEGEVYEYQEEEDQGLTNQGKPSILDAYLILFTYFAYFLKVYQIACFYIAVVLIAIICWLKLHKPNCYHPSRWPLWTPIQYPCSSGLLVSSKAFGKPLVEPKTLGWELKWILRATRGAVNRRYTKFYLFQFKAWHEINSLDVQLGEFPTWQANK